MKLNARMVKNMLIRVSIIPLRFFAGVKFKNSNVMKLSLWRVSIFLLFLMNCMDGSVIVARKIVRNKVKLFIKENL